MEATVLSEYLRKCQSECQCQKSGHFYGGIDKNMLRNLSLLKLPKTIYQSKKLKGVVTNRSEYWRERVGNREMVGYGTNGLPTYSDRLDFPFPAIRYKEITGELHGLFEKQKGNWNELTKEEKKKLYRASFCQTFQEFRTPTAGKASEIIGYSLILISVGIWVFIIFQFTIFPEKPESFRPSNVRAQMRRMIDLQMNPVQGISSNWDYEKNDWKVKRWYTPPNPFLRYPDDP